MNRLVIMLSVAGFLLGLGIITTGLASAEDVGHFEQVINKVDHLKQSQEPAVPAKVPDGVANQDMVKTHEQSRAQLGFVDDTKMTIAPQTEMTIEDYMYDAKNQRRVVTQVYKGVVETVVPNAVPKDQFTTKTPTATAGIRD
jgi:hypothetical protein